MLKLIKYNDGLTVTDLWYWIDSEERLASPIFEQKEEAFEWAKSKNLQIDGEWL